MATKIRRKSSTIHINGEEIMDTFKAAVLACAVSASVYALTGCESLRGGGSGTATPIYQLWANPPVQYLPSQQFGNGGATPCMDGNCIAVHQHKALPPCN